MKAKTFFNKFIYFTCFLFINTMKLDDTQKNITVKHLENGGTSYGNLSNNQSSQIYKVIFEVNITHFINIYLKGKNNASYILSFYPNNSINFTKRDQLFKSYNNEIVMWLNQNQFINNSYIEVECNIYPCSYDINITGNNDNIKLEFNKIYSYYITEEIINMTFVFNDTLPDETNMVTFWANGNKEIKSNLTTNNKKIPIGENIYQIVLDGGRKCECKFVVSGKLEDIINIGALTFNKSNYSSLVLKDDIEIYGFLNNKSQNNCFVYDHPSKFGNLTLMNQEYENIFIDFYKDSFCLYLTNKSIEIFYSFYYYTFKNDNNTKEMKSPYIYGFEHSTRYVKENDSVLFVLVKPEVLFDYFIYHINGRNGSFSSPQVYLCNNYPLCDFTNMVKMKIYKHSHDCIFFKKDLYDFLYHPLNKRQILVKITCEKAEVYNKKENLTNDYIPGYCLFDLNTYQQDYTSKYEIIDKNVTISYDIVFDYTINFTDINIEILYGDISIDFINEDPNDYYQIVYKNKYIYEFYGSGIKLHITGKKEKNYYHIIYFPLISEDTYNYINLYNIGGNYLILEDEESSLVTFENKLNENPLSPLSNTSINDTIFIGFYPIKGNFSPMIEKSGDMIQMEMDDLTFYQDIKKIDKDYVNFSYIVNNSNKNNNEECLFSVSVFNLNSADGIILYKENPQLFNFSKENSVMKFTYYHKKNEKNSYGNEFCLIGIKPINNSPMDLKVSYNGSTLYNTINGKEQEIRINFTNYCFENGVCKIAFNLSLKDTSKSNLVKINIYTGNDKLFWIMLLSNIAIIAIVIIIILLLILDYLRSNSFKIKESNGFHIIGEDPLLDN